MRSLLNGLVAVWVGDRSLVVGYPAGSNMVRKGFGGQTYHLASLTP